MNKLSHIDNKGNVKMVDISAKEPTKRVAVAKGFIKMQPQTVQQIKNGQANKGDVLTTAKIAAINASKQTSNLIPMCHLLALDNTKIDFNYEVDGIGVCATCITFAKTGVEMEALTAVSVACLTIYDMAKAMDKNMQILKIYLVKKTGGSSNICVK